MNTQQKHYAALAFLAEHQGEYLSHDERGPLIDRCIQHLVDTAFVSKKTAEAITLQAYGERESRTCRAYVDMSLTTSFTVFVRDPNNGRMHVFTAAELLALCSPSLPCLTASSAKDLPAKDNGDRTPL